MHTALAVEHGPVKQTFNSNCADLGTSAQIEICSHQVSTVSWLGRLARSGVVLLGSLSLIPSTIVDILQN
jgi:hypothetical protein